jgi:hypothetical protein
MQNTKQDQHVLRRITLGWLFCTPGCEAANPRTYSDQAATINFPHGQPVAYRLAMDKQ